jgi:hypothetical protein
MKSSGRSDGEGACMGRRVKQTGFWWKIQKERDHQEDLDLDENIKL